MRALWVLLMIAGVIVFGGFAIVMILGIPIGNDLEIRSRGIWPIAALLAAGACGAGIFMSPGEFRETMRPPPPPERPAWMDELAKPPPADNKRG
jgi:hypothetical protein